VLVAADGIEGVSAFKQQPAEIALLIPYVMMPNMNGFDLADSVLELDSDLPVNIYSADRATGVSRNRLRPLPWSAACGRRLRRPTERGPRRRRWSVIHQDLRCRHGKPDRPGSILSSLGLRGCEKS
jgi:hypothetical protein